MAAPKGNKYALGNRGGQPAFYTTREALIEAVDAYFQSCIEENEKPTITGLVLGLGFGSRKSLDDYEEKEEFSYIIKYAKTLVEHAYEKKLDSQAVAGAIFALKQMGWRDRTDTDITSGGKTIGYNLDKLTPEEKLMALALQQKMSE